MKKLIYTLIVITVIGFSSCNEKPVSLPIISISNPDTRAPLYYNEDTLFLQGIITDEILLTEVKLRMEDKDMQIVYSNIFYPMVQNYNLIDSIKFIVNDHTNYILYINAINEEKGESEYSIFIHVMP